MLTQRQLFCSLGGKKTLAQRDNVRAPLQFTQLAPILEERNEGPLAL